MGLLKIIFLFILGLWAKNEQKTDLKKSQICPIWCQSGSKRKPFGTNLAHWEITSDKPAGETGFVFHCLRHEVLTASLSIFTTLHALCDLEIGVGNMSRWEIGLRKMCDWDWETYRENVWLARLNLGWLLWWSRYRVSGRNPLYLTVIQANLSW